MRRAALPILTMLVIVATPRAQATVEKLDYATIGRIRDEGLNRSQVMDHVSWLADVYGPRLTGGPGLRGAADWALKKFDEWGLANAHREPFPFGKGWSLERFSAHLIAPQTEPLIGHPAAWSPGTNGPVTADVVRAQVDGEADFAKHRGKLAGKIVLTQPPRIVRMLEGRVVLRMNDEDFEEAATTPIPAPRDPGRRGRAEAEALRRKIEAFFKAEGAVALLSRGSDNYMAAAGSGLSIEQQRPDGGTVFPAGGSRDADPGSGLPTVTLAVEQYNRMVRVLDRGVPVKVELDVRAKFYEESSPNGFNVVAEIPGADAALKDEVVMLGAHLDSVAYSPGATDNATGCAAVMEAMRILKAIGAKPRRTIRVALWGGEEQGLLGSRAYVREHFADVTTMTLKPAHPSLSAYFNSDNGSGRIRGIWLQGNLAARQIFEQWIEPLRDLGVTAIGPRSVGSTDHVSFDNAGLPAFQFMVDRLEYNSRTHHSNMDTVDRVQRDDMIQHATVIAVFAWNAANRQEKLPRKALPSPQRGQTSGDDRR